MNARRLLVGVGGGLGTGLALNFFAKGAPWVDWVASNLTYPVGTIFLRLLFMLVIPLIVSALAVGIGEIELSQLGRLGLKTLGYSVGVSLVAVLIGLGLVNTIRPGAGVGAGLLALAKPAGAQAGAAAVAGAATTPSAVQMIVQMVPDNPIKAMASGDMLGVMVFALVLGVALAVTRTRATAQLRDALQGLYDVMMTCIGWVMWLAPVGIGALLFTMGVRLGTDLLRPLLAYVATVLLGLTIHLVVVYSALIKIVGRRSPWQFFLDVRLAMLTAFSTASSSATLPTSLRVAEENLHLPPGPSRFVLTVGSTMNQNGTALYEGITVLFLAQLAGVDLSLGQQAVVMVIAVLAGVGTAGVPGGSLPALAMILALFRIPPEGLALIFGVDRLLDMARTTLNVVGDLVVAVCVAGDKAAEPPIKV